MEKRAKFNLSDAAIYRAALICLSQTKKRLTNPSLNSKLPGSTIKK